MSARTCLVVAAATLFALPAWAAGKERQRREPIDDAPAWATHPDQTKLDIVERLVLEKQQYRAALGVIAAMRREGVESPVLDLVQGIALREEGLLVEAEEMLLQARKRLPADARVHDALCVLYADQQALDPAVAACEKATRLDPGRASAWNNLGYLYLVTDRGPEAVEACAQATELDGAEPRYRNNLAMAYAATGDYPHALDLFRTTGSEADAQYNVGVAVERTGDPQEAISWYRRALDADAAHAPASDAVTRLTNPTEPQETPDDPSP